MPWTARRFRPVVSPLEDRTTPAIGTLAASSAFGSVVGVFDSGGTFVRSVAAFEGSFTGGVRVALADVNGDLTPDVIAGSGPGRPAAVRVFDGTTGSLLSESLPF